jgi:hypothetical protein
LRVEERSRRGGAVKVTRKEKSKQGKGKETSGRKSTEMWAE